MTAATRGRTPRTMARLTYSHTRLDAHWRAAKALSREPGQSTLFRRHIATAADCDASTFDNWRRGVGKPDADQLGAILAVLQQYLPDLSLTDFYELTA